MTCSTCSFGVPVCITIIIVSSTLSIVHCACDWFPITVLPHRVPRDTPSSDESSTRGSERSRRQSRACTSRGQTPRIYGLDLRPARGYDRYVHSRGNSLEKFDVIPVARAVAVHACEHDLPAPRSSTSRANSTASMPVGVLPPWVWTSKYRVRRLHRLRAFRVDGHHDALAAEPLRPAVDDIGSIHCGGVDGHLVRPGPEYLADVLDRTDTAAHGERYEHPLGDTAHTMSSTISRRSEDAVMSRNTSSSAFSAS